jgi:hypothetical protein
MGLYRRPDSPHYIVELRWRGYPRIRLSTGATSRTRAQLVESTLLRLRETGRRDLIELLVTGKLKLAELHAKHVHDPKALEQPLTRQESPELGPLVEAWLDWLRDPGTISPRTRRPYAPQSIRRYADSWKLLFALLPAGRDTRLGDLTRGSMIVYRKARRQAGADGATVNRDLTAIQSLLRWSEEERGLPVPHFRIPKEREPEGKERWLDATEIGKIERVASQQWWALFAVLLYTGMRIGEARTPVGRRAAQRAPYPGSRTRRPPVEDGLQPARLADRGTARAAAIAACGAGAERAGRSRFSAAVRRVLERAQQLRSVRAPGGDRAMHHSRLAPHVRCSLCPVRGATSPAPEVARPR